MPEPKRERDAKKQWVWSGPGRRRQRIESGQGLRSWWIAHVDRAAFALLAAAEARRMRVSETSTAHYAGPVGSKTPTDRPERKERKYHEEAEDADQE